MICSPGRYDRSQPSQEGTITGPNESESEPFALIGLRMALAFVGSLDWLIATLLFNLLGTPGAIARAMGAIALVSGASLMVLAAGLLGSVAHRWTAMQASLAGPLIVAAYGAWRLVHGSHANDPGADVAIALLAISAAAILVVSLRIRHRQS